MGLLTRGLAAREHKEELEAILKTLAKRGGYCRTCASNRAKDGDCSPMELTYADSRKLDENHRKKYFKLESCPYYQ